MYMYEGDTVRLKVNFKTFTGIAVNPINPKLIICDKDEVLIEQFILDDTNKENVGVYFYDYTPAIGTTDFIFEFSGTYNSKPILTRGQVQIKFI